MKKLILLGLAIGLIFPTGCVFIEEPCEKVSYDNKYGLNFLFFQDGFSEEKFRNLSSYIVNSIKEKEPFRTKAHFNIYRIPNNDSSICKQGKPLPLIGAHTHYPIYPLNCNIEKIQNLVNSCNVNKGKIIIVTNDTVVSQTSLSFSESAVMFLDMKNQPPEVIQHEFAHFFGLVDEKAKLYSHALGPGKEEGPNCVKTKQEAGTIWQEFYPGNHTFPPGCAGNPEWYKPEEKTLLGRQPDPAYGYGKFNTWYMGRVMECCYSRQKKCEEFFNTYSEWKNCRK